MTSMATTCHLPAPAGPCHLLRVLRVRPDSSVACAISGVNSVMISEMVPWEPQKIGNNFFDDILPFVQQRYHDRFPQGEALRPPGSLIPGIGHDIFDTRLKFIELSGIQSEGTMVTQRLLRR